MERKQATTVFLLALAAVGLYLCYVIARPFLGPVFLAATLAIVCRPVHTHVFARIRRPNTAALISTSLVLLVLILPTIGLAVALSKEITGLYRTLNEGSGGQEGWNPFVIHALERALSRLGRYVDVSPLHLRAELVQSLKSVAQPILSWEITAVTDIAGGVINAAIAFFILFFFFRDAESLKERAGQVLPLSAQQVQRLFKGVSNSIVANVYGCLAVGLVQGLLCGVAFWVLGLHSPALWGLVAALFSLLPVVGSAAVWGPGAVILLLHIHWWKGVVLFAWGAAVVAQAGNVVRSYVIGKRSNLNTLWVFFAVLGGVAAFGFVGLIVGPVILSVTIVVLEMLREPPPDVFPSPQ